MSILNSIEKNKIRRKFDLMLLIIEIFTSLLRENLIYFGVL